MSSVKKHSSFLTTISKGVALTDKEGSELSEGRTPSSFTDKVRIALNKAFPKLYANTGLRS